MTLRFAAPLCLLFAPGAALAQTATQEPPARAPQIRWAPDGVHLLVGGARQDARTGSAVEAPASGVDGREASDTAAGASEAPPRAATTRAGVRAALAAARGSELSEDEWRGNRPRSTLPRAPEPTTGFRFSGDERTAAGVLDGRLWVWSEEAGARAVGAGGLQGVRHFAIAPDGSAVSYLSGYDLHIAHTKDGATLPLTKDGGEEMFHGELDWVYQEELYGRFDFQGAFWAPTGEHLAFLSIDESGVDTFTVVDYRPQGQALEQIKYPKAGTVNPRAHLSIARAADGATVRAELSGYTDEDGILLVRVGWTPEGQRAFVFVQDREQTWSDLWFVDPTTGASERLFRDQLQGAWVDRPNEPHWLSDGTFLHQSANSGYEHLYRYQRDGSLLAAVTSGPWRVRSIERVDEAGGWLTVTGSAPEYAIGDTHWRASLDGGEPRRLTQGRGHWRLDWNADGSLAIARVEHMELAGETWLLDAAGNRLRQLDVRPTPEDARPGAWHQVPTRDGDWIDVVVTLPEPFDPELLYPVWLDTYAGPDAPSIQDRFRNPTRRSDWYVGLSVNVRSASGRGMRYTSLCYRDFGAAELRDLEDAVGWLLENHPFCDPSRVALSGWSYGGFMAAYAMANSKVFSCAVAGAGVYDWALYDTIYTERYMGLPQTNPEGYARAHVIAGASRIQGPLLVVHGAMDDNVHVQNAMLLALALQEAGRQDFEFMIYPTSRHGVRSPHWPTLRENFLRRHLGAPKARQ